MARFLDSMKAGENGHHHPTAPPTPAGPPLSLVGPESTPDDVKTAATADEETAMPYIEVGPCRSVEGSPDVLACPPGPTFRAIAAAEAPRVVAFCPLPAPVQPAPAMATEIVAFHEPESAVSLQYRDLQGAISKAASVREPATLLFTGSAAGVGTTTVVLNLAVTAARAGRRVIVIDANVRRPAIAARLALCDRPGLSEVLDGTVTLDESLQESEQSNLAALTHGGPILGAARSASAYRSLLRQLRHGFDLVLIDGPRWDGRSDVTAPGAASDAAFLVVPAGCEQSITIQQLLRQIPGQGVRLAGCIAVAR
jgi:Mrp family chromosome partitioning ATPase